MTRRLARATALEVQSQFRPIIVPVEGTFQVTDPTRDAGAGEYEIMMQLRNIGSGPALDVRLAIGPEGLVVFVRGRRFPEYEVIAPRATVGAVIKWAMMGETNYATPSEPSYGVGPAPTGPIRITYSDMAGRLFETEFDWVVWKWLGPGERPTIRTGSVKLKQGLRPRPTLFPWTTDALEMSRFPRPGWGWSVLRTYLIPYPGTQPDPLIERLRKTWRGMRGERSQVFSQRVQWGFRAFKQTKPKPVPQRVPSVLVRPYILARGLRYGWRAYRRIR